MPYIKKALYRLFRGDFKGILRSVVAIRERKQKRKKFKSEAVEFLSNINQLAQIYSFRPTAIGKLLLSEYPFNDIYKDISKNRHLLLSPESLFCGYSTKLGDLIWNQDFIDKIDWPNNVWGVDIPYKLNQGDIKRPWELGRLSCLVQLGLCFRADPKNDKKYLQAFDEILSSFSVSNPYYQGPQWMSAMEVAIRSANICLAASLFESKLSCSQKICITRELLRHEFFIERNLEKTSGFPTGNHYVANLVGLLFCKHHLLKNGVAQSTQEIQEELLRELCGQFLPDGANFEGSTYYHRLTAELQIFAWSLCFEDVRDPDLANTVTKKLQSIAHFSQVVTDFTGYVPQIGDNDSAHLFLLNPKNYKENDLNHDFIIKGVQTFTEHKTELFTQVLNANLTPKPILKSPKANQDRSIHYGDYKAYQQTLLTSVSRPCVQKYKISCGPTGPIESNHFFPDFGLFILKGPEFFLSFRCGMPECDVLGSHRHFDQLSFQLKTKHYEAPRDPGSFTYTADSSMRNLFRSPLIHHVPFNDSAEFKSDEIFLLPLQKAKCIYFGRDGFYGYYQSGKELYYRIAKIFPEYVEVFDWTHSQKELPRLKFIESHYSSRYGKLE